jgi:hypothetical protein
MRGWWRLRELSCQHFQE